MADLSLLNPINISDPVNVNHPLNQGRAAWWLTIPELAGGAYFYDLTGFSRADFNNITSGFGWRATTRPGGYGHIKLDGTDDNLTLGSDIRLRMGVDFTISAWVNFDYGPGINYFAIIQKGGGVFGTDTNYDFGVRGGSNNHFYLYFRNGTTLGGKESADFSTTSNVWQMLSATYVNSTKTTSLYLNGLFLTSAIATVSPVTDSTPATIGGRTGPSNEGLFTGLMDDISIWSRALSASELAQLYTSSMTGYVGILNRFSIDEYVEIFPPSIATFRGRTLMGVGQ